MNVIIQQLVNTGLPTETIILFLMFPVIATFVAIVRHIIGLPTMGFYISLLFGICFYFLGNQDFKGLIYGVPITIVVMALAVFFRNITSEFKMHYLPRMSLLVSLVCLLTLAIVAILASVSNGQILLYNVFPILVIIILSERFVALLISKNEQTVMIRLLESIFTGAILYLILTWKELTNFILNYPEIIILVLIINIIIANTSQIRLTEFLRFGLVMKEHSGELSKERNPQS